MVWGARGRPGVGVLERVSRLLPRRLRRPGALELPHHYSGSAPPTTTTAAALSMGRPSRKAHL